VYEGADQKLKQLGTGLLEKLGIGGASWEKEERDRYRSTMVPVENQLAPGQAVASEQRRIQPATSRAFEVEDQLEYVELEERRQREPLRQRRYLDEEDGSDFIDEPIRGSRGLEARPAPRRVPPPPRPETEDRYDDDPW
jgi:hypothetical protein